MECENNLFIHIETDERKDYIMNILSNNIKLFESFIPLSQTKLDCYGTSSDVYIEYIDIKLVTDFIHLKFYTYLTPCLDFCKKLASIYNVNIELVYYNEYSDFSGKLHIHRNQIVKDERYSYLQGVYFNNKDNFWELVYPYFTINSTFIEFVLEKKLSVTESDFKRLNCLYDEFLFCNDFNKII